MHLTYGFLFLYVFVQFATGAPLRLKRDPDNDLSPSVYSSTIPEDYMEFSPFLDYHPDPNPTSVMSYAKNWQKSGSGLDYFSTHPTSDFAPTDHDSEPTDWDPTPGMDEAFLASGEANLVIRPRTDLIVRPRSGEAAEKAGDGMSQAGEVISKVAKGAAEIPEIGEILGPALQVVSYVLQAIGKFLHGLAEEMHKSDKERGEYTQNVTAKTLKEHPGWLVVTIHTKHTAYFQGQRGVDWAHRKTQIKTVTGVYDYDVYSARAGIFINRGDGGYLNWAYAAPVDKLQAYGSQGHRLVYKGGGPKVGKPKSGNCGFHIYQYQKHEGSANPTNHYMLDVIIKDAAGNIVGFEGNGDGSKPLLVHSQLPHALRISTGKRDSDPLSFVYGQSSWKSDNKRRCKVGSYDSGYRQMDCSFGCTF